MRAIAIVGSKKSGKTTTTEKLIREFARRGYKVAAIKHISEADFTIDTAGKDTWRFAKAGATKIISVAANEVATIEKLKLKNLTLEKLLKKCADSDLVVIEGFKKLVASQNNIPKIVIAQSQLEVADALIAFKPILAFSGPSSPKAFNSELPYVDGLRKPEKLADIIENAILKS